MWQGAGKCVYFYPRIKQRMKFIKLIPSLFLCSFFIVQIAWGQCGCDHTLTGLSNTNVNIINASSFTYSPGDVFCIQADTIAGLRFVGFAGTAAQPLTFKNCGGKVVVQEDSYSGIAFVSSQYVRLTGTGDSAHQYGFHVIETGSGSMGVNVGGLSSDAMIDHIEVQDVGFAGIMAKTDPNCNDTMTWRRNGFVLRNLSIHDNFIHDTEGEGMYIGYTGGYKVSSNRICNGDTVFGHWLEDVEIYDNILENTGWDAIQVNLVRSNGIIRDNWVRNSGVANQTFQNFAMSIGGGIYEIYNNYFFNDPGMPGKGMQLISAESGTKLYNNVFIDMKGHAIFMHNRHKFDDPNLGYALINNTIIRPEESAILYNSTITTSLDPNEVGTKQDDVPVYFHNNLITSPECDYVPMGFWKQEQECFFDFNNKSTRDSQLVNISSNMMSRQMDTLGLLDTLNLDFSLAGPNSILIDAGIDVSTFGVTFDHDYMARPFGMAYDIGAYEWTPIVNIDNPVGDDLRVYPNPTKNRLYLESHSTISQVELYSLQGQRYMIDWNGDYLNLSGLSSGVYILKVQNAGGEVLTRKVIRK